MTTIAPGAWLGLLGGVLTKATLASAFQLALKKKNLTINAGLTTEKKPA